jgi:hypothetical protein
MEPPCLIFERTHRAFFARGDLLPTNHTKVIEQSPLISEKSGYEAIRFTDEQIIGFLKQADAGMSVKELCRSGGFSQLTFFKWRSRFGGMALSDAAELGPVF